MKIYTAVKVRHLFLMLVSQLIIYSVVIAQGFSPRTATRLQHVIDSFQNNLANPVVGGISVAIKVDGLASWQGVTGYAARNVDAQNNLLPGGTLFTFNTPSRIYSITKTFTSALVLELANEGFFSLDDPIGKYLPLMNLYNPSLNSSVTIRQLLSHESGYQDWEENLQLQIAIAFQPTKVWTAYELMAFTEQLVPPGTVRRYSHNNYVFLGAIIEAATGKHVEDLYHERFFTPLGLSSMYMDGREDPVNNEMLAAPHDNISPFNPIFLFTGQPTFPDAYTNIYRFPFTAITSLGSAGGGLISDVADIAEWGNALFGGRATPKWVVDSMLKSISPTVDEAGNKLGYGIKEFDKISGKFDFVGHNGSAPGYRSGMFYQPEKKMTIAILSNFAGADQYAVGKALYQALPEFTTGNDNRKEAKIIVCFNGHTQAVDRGAADELIKKGAYLGSCDQSSSSIARATTEATAISEKASINLFPNPASDHISVSFTTPKSQKVNLGLYDMNGKLVAVIYNGMMEKNTARRFEVETGKLFAGSYICRLQTAEGIMQKSVLIMK